MEEEFQPKISDKEKVIKLNQEATFGDLFSTLNEIEEESMNEETEGDVDTDDPTGFYQELHDHFDLEVVEEVLDIQTRLDALWFEDPEKYDSEDRRLIALRVLDYFEKKGYSMDEIEAFLPIEFEKEKRGK